MYSLSVRRVDEWGYRSLQIPYNNLEHWVVPLGCSCSCAKRIGLKRHREDQLDAPHQGQAKPGSGHPIGTRILPGSMPLSHSHWRIQMARTVAQSASSVRFWLPWVPFWQGQTQESLPSECTHMWLSERASSVWIETAARLVQTACVIVLQGYMYGGAFRV